MALSRAGLVVVVVSSIIIGFIGARGANALFATTEIEAGAIPPRSISDAAACETTDPSAPIAVSFVANRHRNGVARKAGIAAFRALCATNNRETVHRTDRGGEEKITSCSCIIAIQNSWNLFVCALTTM